MKIKVIPVKSLSLCEKCYFNWSEHCDRRHKGKSCTVCPVYKEGCECNKIEFGEPCRSFINKEKYKLIEKKIAQKIDEVFGLLKERIKRYEQNKNKT